jgi:hypothetical protein
MNLQVTNCETKLRSKNKTKKFELTISPMWHEIVNQCDHQHLNQSKDSLLV